MLILGIILFGMGVGWLAQKVLGRGDRRTDWTLAFVAGIAGSFVGGLVGSLLFDDGLSLRPSGLIGSFVGALIVTGGYQWYQGRQTRQA